MKQTALTEPEQSRIFTAIGNEIASPPKYLIATSDTADDTRATKTSIKRINQLLK